MEFIVYVNGKRMKKYNTCILAFFYAKIMLKKGNDVQIVDNVTDKLVWSNGNGREITDTIN